MLTHRKTVKTLVAFLLIAGLTACAAPTPTQSAPSPTAAPPHSTPTTTPFISPATVWALEVTAPATAIPSPTLTATPRPTHTPTRTPRLDPQATLTQQAYELFVNQVAGFPETCAPGSSDRDASQRDWISPNGNWLASACGYKRDRILDIVNHEGKHWKFQFKDYLTAEFTRDGGMSMGGLYPAHWTSDESYLYFTSYVGIDGGGTCFYGFGSSGLFRVELGNGAVSIILPPRSAWDGYKIAFSPGGRWLAYSVDHPVILDFKTGQKSDIDVGKAVVGSLTWSPDGSQLAYATCQTTDNFDEITTSTIQVYDLASHKSEVIMQTEGNQLSARMQSGNSLLEIYNDNRQNEHKVFSSYFDWTTEQFVTPTPTPNP